MTISGICQLQHLHVCIPILKAIRLMSPYSSHQHTGVGKALPASYVSLKTAHEHHNSNIHYACDTMVPRTCEVNSP